MDPKIEETQDMRDGSETSDEFVKVDNDVDMQVAEESSAITELETPASEPIDSPQLMEPLIPVTIPKEEPVVESKETEATNPEPQQETAPVEEQKPDVVPPTEPVKTEENEVEAPAKAEEEDDAPAAAGFTELSKAGLKELSKSVENIVPLSNEEAAKEDKPASTVDEKPTPVMDLMYWKDAKKSAIAFSFTLMMLTSLNYYSSILVVSYLLMSLITITMSCRVYSFAVQTVNGTQLQNPFSAQLGSDVTISKEQAMEYIDYLLPKVNCVVSHLRDLIFVNKFVDTLKFGVCIWLLSYIGECFNGLSLLILNVIIGFTAPPVYKKYETEINQHVGVAMKKVTQVVNQIKSKIPGKKAKTQ